MSTVTVVEASTTMVTSSNEHGWDIPEVDGDKDKWGEYLNNTIRALDVAVILKDKAANRPAAGTTGRWFLATDTGTLYYDNGTSWETIIGRSMPDTTFRLAGTHADNGTASAPAYSFDADTDTGIWRPTADQLALVTGGVNALTADANQNVALDNGDLIDGAGNVVYDQSNKYVPSSRIDESTLDAATLGGSGPSYYTNHANATNVGAEDHHPQIQVSNGGTALLTQPTDLNFGSGVSAVDDGDGTITVTGSSNAPVTSGVVTLSSNSAVISTGVTTTGTNMTVYLDPSGNGNNTADVKASARSFWDNGAGEYKVEILEDGTNIGNPDIGYEVFTS